MPTPWPRCSAVRSHRGSTAGSTTTWPLRAPGASASTTSACRSPCGRASSTGWFRSRTAAGWCATCLAHRHALCRGMAISRSWRAIATKCSMSCSRMPAGRNEKKENDMNDPIDLTLAGGAVRRRLVLAAGGGAALLAVAGCTTTGGQAAEDPAAHRRRIEAGADAALTKLYTQVPAARELVAKARGVLVFPEVISAGFVVGGSY